jgi:hypothetical protein
MKPVTILCCSIVASVLACNDVSAGPIYPFNGAADNQTDIHDYHYAVTGGIFPTGNQPNGTRASGGTMAFITDDPIWGYATQVWHRDTWFAETAGQAMTFRNNGTTIYDNNGIDDGSYGDFYNAQAQGRANADTPGLYQNYAMANNFDFMYASYFKIEQATTIDQIVGYFNGDGFNNTADPNSPLLNYRFNIWSTVGNCTEPNVGCLPVNTGSFNGDIFSMQIAGTGTTSATGVNRVFSNGSTDPIWRVVFNLETPLVLQPGEYYGGHDRVIAAAAPEPGAMALLGLGLASLAAARRRRGASN